MFRLKGLLKCIYLSAGLAAVVTIISSVVCFIVLGKFSGRHIFGANFAAGCLVIFAGVLSYGFPVSVGKSRLLDHTTIGPKVLDAREKSVSIINIGICNVLIVGIAEYLVWMIMK